MNCLVTGAAGFIGSHLCERLLRDGHAVRGLDAFIPFYPRLIKEVNLAAAKSHHAFEFFPIDLRTDPLDAALTGVEAVFHLAAMPGLPRSWTDFDLYESCNVIGTQRMLEAVHGRKSLQRFVYASTSSVYGRYASGDEALPLRPISPYGATKLAAENLCRAFAEERGLPLTVLRYFSVYGPRQRPDMGYSLFVDSLLRGRPIAIYGDGQQVRGNTFVDDCVAASVLALDAVVGESFNVGGGEAISVLEAIRKLEGLTGRKAVIDWKPPREGDQRATFADTGKLMRHLRWRPTVGLDEGLARQVAWQREMLPMSAAA
jgi:nucleoside-diphosphate-sugar epimerase